jgi:primosomal protein N' (replication factor Y)
MEKDSIKFIVDVAPIARLPLSRQQFFSYLSDNDLPAGSLVSIPLFNREIQGVVLDSRPDTERDNGYKLKNVSAVLEENFLTKGQLMLAQQLSSHYLTSLGVVLKHFLPKRVTARSTTQHTIYKIQKEAKITLTQEQINTVNTISETKKLMPKKLNAYLLHGPASSGKTEVYIHSILKLKEKNPDKQFLILLPELTLTPQALERYGAYFDKKEIALLHSKLGKGEFYQTWKRIATGEAKIIIATRIGIFAPFQDLGAIFVDEEQDMSFKQWDMNPRYDARQGGEFLAENFNAPIVFGSATPRIESYYKTTTGEYTLLKLPTLPESIMGRAKTTPDIEVVDMRKETWTDFAGKKTPNHSLLSMRLQAEISYALSQKLQTILFVNHQGMSTFSVCSNCKAVLKCPKCERALIYNESGGYNCLHCNFKESIVPSCKACGSLTFQNIGIGTQLVEKEVKKLFGSARISRLDSTSAKKPGALNEIFENFAQGNIDVLIGTQMITKGWDNPRVELVAIIDSDSLFTNPDFLTDEKAFANILQVAGRTGRVGTPYPGHVIIQTFDPLRRILQKIATRDSKSFYEKEIELREDLRLPPFGKLIKLSFKDAEKTKVEKEVQAVYEKISEILSNTKGISATAPYDPLISKIRGKFIQQIILKTGTGKNSLPEANALQSEAVWPAELIKILSSLSTNWSIDVDPIQIA